MLDSALVALLGSEILFPHSEFQLLKISHCCTAQNFDRENIDEFDYVIRQNFTVQFFLQQLFVCKNGPISPKFYLSKFS